MKNERPLAGGEEACVSIGADNAVSSPNRNNPQATELAYAAWRRADSEWELARHAPKHIGQDLPDELGTFHCDATHGALIGYLLTPAEDIRTLHQKLLTIHREQLFSGCYEGDDIGRTLVDDARQLLMRQPMEALHG